MSDCFCVFCVCFGVEMVKYTCAHVMNNLLPTIECFNFNPDFSSSYCCLRKTTNGDRIQNSLKWPNTEYWPNTQSNLDARSIQSEKFNSILTSSIGGPDKKQVKNSCGASRLCFTSFMLSTNYKECKRTWKHDKGRNMTVSCHCVQVAAEEFVAFST